MKSFFFVVFTTSNSNAKTTDKTGRMKNKQTKDDRHIHKLCFFWDERRNRRNYVDTLPHKIIVNFPQNNVEKNLHI